MDSQIKHRNHQQEATGKTEGGRLAGYHLVDFATQIYLFTVTLLILGFRGVPFWLPLALAHLVGMVAVHALVVAHARRPEHRGLRLFRFLYPLILYVPLYTETGILNLMIFPRYLDASFMAAEQWLFGFQPGIDLMSWMPWLPLSELLYFAYFTYFFQVTVGGLYLYFTNRRACAHFVAMVSVVFYVCYLLFILLPVIGPPKFWLDVPEFAIESTAELAAEYNVEQPLEFPENVSSGPFFQVMLLIYKVAEYPGGAFPSSHVAVALVVLYMVGKYIRRLWWPMLIITVLLSIATVYCRYHYAIDVFAGIALTAILIPVVNRLHQRFLD